MLHVGVSGKIASGKSTLAKALKQLAIESGYACEIVPFAHGVREVAALECEDMRRALITNLFYSWGYNYGVSLAAALLADQYMEEYPSEEGKKNRRLLQCIGTEVGRNTVAEDVWIRRTHAVFDTLSFLHSPLDFGISDDVRFNNEAYACDVHVHIEVIDLDQQLRYSERIENIEHYDHVSEHALSVPPLFTLPINFRQRDVRTLFEKIDQVRRLRG